MKFCILFILHYTANALRCLPDSVSERTNTSTVILSATCEKLVPGQDSKTCLIARVWRVIKGKHLLDEIGDKTRSASEYGYDLTLPVYGFDSKKICKSKIRENETKILFATLSPDRHRLMLSNTPLHITERNLDEVEALAHDVATLDPCSNVVCHHGSQCKNGDCVCNISCFGELSEPICGSDSVTYLNLCQLKKTQCEKKTPISMQYMGLCSVNTRFDCKDDTDCGSVGQVCDNGVCKCDVCDKNDIKNTDICGSDGNTYQSRCHLNRRACLENRFDLSVQYLGVCKVCQPVYWSGEPTNNSRYCQNSSCGQCPVDPIETSVCDYSKKITYRSECFAKCSGASERDLIDGTCEEQFKAELLNDCSECETKECKFSGSEKICSCSICPDVNHPVCGSDGQTYLSNCVLLRTNCENSKLNVRKLHDGKCGTDGNGNSNDPIVDCDVEGCEYGGICFGGSCDCDFECSESMYNPVCGSNGVTYTNQCLLLQDQCQRQRGIEVLHNNECTAMECSNNEKNNCPIYTEACVEGNCICPSCDDERYDSDPVCASNGREYDSRCQLRSFACRNNLEIFEVPCDQFQDELEFASGDGFPVCHFGGELVDANADDEDTLCKCDWHCPTKPNGGDIIQAEGVTFDTLCKYYREGNCKSQRELRRNFKLCNCDDSIGVLDKDFCDSHGACLCKPRFKGKFCTQCQDDFYLDRSSGDCEYCQCSFRGSLSGNCSASGVCSCKPGWSGPKCETETEPPQDCDSCSSSDRTSGKVCGSDRRFYSSICALKQIHCRLSPKGQMPYAMSNQHCQQSGDDSPIIRTTQEPQGTVVPPVVTRTTERTVITTVISSTPQPSRATPTVTTIQTTMETYSGSGDGSDCPFDEECDDSFIFPNNYDQKEHSDDSYLISTDDEDIKGSPYIYDSREPARRPIMETKNMYEDLPSYEIKLYVTENVQGEQLLESVSDDVKRIFQSMIPNIREIQVDNVTRSSDHITAILNTVPVQQPEILKSRYNEWIEQGEPAIADRIEIGKSFWFGGSSYAKYNFVNSFPIRKTFELSIRLRIRTTEPDGLILWIGPDADSFNGVRSKESPSLILAVRSGMLELTCGLETIKQEPETVTDNEWHTIDIRFNRGSISFTLDDGFNNYAYSEVNEVNVVQFYLGGVPESVEPEILSQLNLHKGFTGCILMNYAVTSQLTGQYQANILKARNRRFCNGQSACQLNPCGSQGEMEINEGQCHEFGSAVLPDERLCLHNDNIENNPDMKFNGFAYAVLPTKRLDKFEMKFTTPERLKDYILLHIEDDLIIFVQNGYVVVDVNNDGVFSLVHKSKLPLNTTKDTTIELTFTKNELKINYCQESCGRKIGDQIDVFKKPENKKIFIGKLHETVFHVAPERLRMLSGFNSIVTSVKVNGEKKNLWREASLMRLVSAIKINPGEYSGRISGDDTIDKWYKFERPNTYFNQIKEQVKQHDEMTIKLNFKTTSTHGSLVYMSNNQFTDFIHISIRDGYVFLNFMLDNEELELDLYYNQADGTEHTLEFTMQNDLRENYKLLEIKIDGNQDYVQDIIWTVAPLKSNGLLYIGGKPETNDALVEGFDGCMSSIFIDSKPLRITADAKHFDEMNSECRIRTESYSEH